VLTEEKLSEIAHSNFEGPIRRSGPCHRLLRYAYERQRELQIGECVPHETCIKNDLQTKLVDALFDAFFVQNEDIADYHVLAKYSEEVGLMTYDEVRFPYYFWGFPCHGLWAVDPWHPLCFFFPRWCARPELAVRWNRSDAMLGASFPRCSERSPFDRIVLKADYMQLTMPPLALCSLGYCHVELTLLVCLPSLSRQTLAFLKSSAYKEEVEELIEQAQDRGISGVPYTVINSKWAIEGGQTAETYYNVSPGVLRFIGGATSLHLSGCGCLG